jgi:DNA transformation protein and related proteins
MFGGYGISTDGLTIAIIADLGAGEKLWLKGDDSTRSQYEAAGCALFTYDMKGVPKSMNYFSAPDAAMDSADAMRPWAALALACAMRANASKRKPRPVTSAKAVQQSTGQTTIAKATKLSPAVLQRAQEVAKKLALSKNLPSPIAMKAPTNTQQSSRQAACPNTVEALAARAHQQCGAQVSQRDQRGPTLLRSRVKAFVKAFQVSVLGDGLRRPGVPVKAQRLARRHPPGLHHHIVTCLHLQAVTSMQEMVARLAGQGDPCAALDFAQHRFGGRAQPDGTACGQGECTAGGQRGRQCCRLVGSRLTGSKQAR